MSAWIILVALLALAFCVGLVLLAIEARRVARRPNPFGGYSAPMRGRFIDGDRACPNCCRAIEDTDAIRASGNLIWHERCARRMEAAGLWNGGAK